MSGFSRVFAAKAREPWLVDCPVRRSIPFLVSSSNRVFSCATSSLHASNSSSNSVTRLLLVAFSVSMSRSRWVSASSAPVLVPSPACSAESIAGGSLNFTDECFCPERGILLNDASPLSGVATADVMPVTSGS
ncbi:hypothetical protein FRC18_002213 [Serendipita sp. 400]|nr:hypothetical protein FRC18_002213 [Serendipita sp. 400]